MLRMNKMISLKLINYIQMINLFKLPMFIDIPKPYIINKNLGKKTFKFLIYFVITLNIGAIFQQLNGP